MYLSLVDSDGSTNTAGLSTHFIAFAVYLECTGDVTTYFCINRHIVLLLSSHPLQYLAQVCVQSVFSSTDLLHVPLELFDPGLQLGDALVCFVSRPTQRPGLQRTKSAEAHRDTTRSKTLLHNKAQFNCKGPQHL